MSNRHPISNAPVPERTRPWWAHVRSLIEALWAMLGGPEDVLAHGVLDKAEYSFFDTMLRGVEALVRRLLLIAAAEQAPPCHKPSRTAKSKTGGAHRSEPSDPEKAETWRVAFRFAPGVRRRKSMEGEGSEDAKRISALRARVQTGGFLVDAYPLARRFEALLRVFDAPELYVARLMRAIARNKAVLRSFLSIPRLPPWAGAHVLEEIKALVDPAWDTLALRPRFLPNTS